MNSIRFTSSSSLYDSISTSNLKKSKYPTFKFNEVRLYLGSHSWSVKPITIPKEAKYLAGTFSFVHNTKLYQTQGLFKTDL